MSDYLNPAQSDVSKAPLRIAHLSDMHVYRVSLSPKQLLSKRWLATFNLLTNRRHRFSPDPSPALADYLSQSGLDHLIFSGDLSTSSLAEEFAAGQRFFDQFASLQVGIHAVPGNHDAYTRRAFRQKRFYQFLSQHDGERLGEFTLERDQVEGRKLGSGWWWIGLDTALATNLISSTGLFSAELEQRLELVLNMVPANDNVILTNHFPVSPIGPPRHRLKHADRLQELLRKNPKVRLYLHGHVHRQKIRDGRSKGLPILLNSGSCGLKGKASFHLIDLYPNRCEVKIIKETETGWEEAQGAEFSF